MSRSYLLRPVIMLAILMLGMTAAPNAVQAGIITDATGDFLATYTGVAGADLDVVSAEVQVNPFTNTIQFFSTMAGNIGTTANGFYVFGLNRGAGTERFNTGVLPVGAGVSFDAVVQLRPNGTGQFNDLINAANSFVFSAGTVQISGASIGTTALNLSLFPSQGFAPTSYTWNLWPRVTGITGNASIPDFAPDNFNASVTAVPEPSSGFLAGIGILAGMSLFRRMKKSA